MIIADDNKDLSSDVFLGKKVICPIMKIVKDIDSVKYHIAIGDNMIRKLIYEKHQLKSDELQTVLHPKSICSEYSEIGPGSFLAAGAIVSVSTKVGINTILNHGCVVDHDCVVGDFCHIAPNATLGGNVKVEDNCMVGAGAVILPGKTIGHSTIIGAGAVVTKDIAPKSVVVGVPAK